MARAAQTLSIPEQRIVAAAAVCSTALLWGILLGAHTAVAQVLTVDALQNQVRLSQTRYRASIQRIKPILSEGLTGPKCPGQRAYDPDDVRGPLSEAKLELLRAVGTSGEADPLRAYIDQTFPAIPAGVKSECFPGFAVVIPGNEYATLTDTVEGLFTTLTTMPSTVVTFTVRSQPTGANIELRSEGSSTTKHQNTTDVELTNVYRGLYVLDVSDDLRKPARLQLNLVDAPPTTVECVLVPASDARTSRCRARK